MSSATILWFYFQFPKNLELKKCLREDMAGAWAPPTSSKYKVISDL